jgi:hypothetical protein
MAETKRTTRKTKSVKSTGKSTRSNTVTNSAAARSTTSAKSTKPARKAAAKTTVTTRSERRFRPSLSGRVHAPGFLRKPGMRAIYLASGVILALEALAILLFSNAAHGSRDIVGNYLANDALKSKAAGKAVYVQGSQRLFTANLAHWVAAFLLVGALAFILTATWRRRRLEDDLGRSTNMMRWLEFAIGGGLVLVVLGIVNGIVDSASLVMLFAFAVVTALFCYLLELRRDLGVPRWLVNTIAIVAGLAPWLVIGMYVKDALVYGSGLPKYIYWLDVTALLLYLALGANYVLSGRRTGRWREYMFAEWLFVLLAVVLKTAVAWQVFAGTLH